MEENVNETKVCTGWLPLCVEVWNDYRNGAVDYENLSVEKYSRKYAVSKFPRNLIAPILLKRAEPALEDADNLRMEVNRWHHSKRSPSKEEAAWNAMEEQAAIAVLKHRGYRVMKKTIAYIDV